MQNGKKYSSLNIKFKPAIYQKAFYCFLDASLFPKAFKND
jgi:hypothetical protein